MAADGLPELTLRLLPAEGADSGTPEAEATGELPQGIAAVEEESL